MDLKLNHISRLASMLAVAIASGAAQGAEAWNMLADQSAVENALNQHIQLSLKKVAEDLEPDTVLGMPQDVFQYCVIALAAVLVLVIIVLVILRVKASASDKVEAMPLDVLTESTKEYTDPNAKPEPRGPGLYLRADVGGTLVRASIRYSEIKEEHGNCVRVGRAGHCWLVVEDPMVSKEHLEIFTQSGKFWVRDSGSKGGSTLNGAQLTHEAMPLSKGDVLQLASRVNVSVRVEERP